MSIPEYAQPRDPSLALCQICANRTDLDLLCVSIDGKLRRFRTCMRYVTGDCNDFVPGNIKRSRA